MRKIAANYILLPGYELVRNGYVVMEEGRVVDVVDTGGKIQEIACLEFYGGMIVADGVRTGVAWEEGENLCDKIIEFYEGTREDLSGLALVQGADFSGFQWLTGTRILRLR